MIGSAGRKVTPHEFHHVIALLYACEGQGLLRSLRLDLLPRKLAISVKISAAKDQDIAKLDLGPLILCNLTQCLSADGASLESVVLLSVLDTPGVVVKQNTSTDYPLLSPSTNAISIGLLHAVCAMDLIKRYAVVKHLLLLVTEMSQAVPLTTGLRVEGPYIIIDDSRWLLIYILFELLSAEERDIGLGIERPVEVDASAGLDFRCGGLDYVVGEAIEGTKLIIFTVSIEVSPNPHICLHFTYKPHALWWGPFLSTGRSENFGICVAMVWTLMETVVKTDLPSDQEIAAYGLLLPRRYGEVIAATPP